jgi:2-polyprenyl-3-methyl-5-hydroxy-6-metoxy-1,4-benzoquinol methylase
MTTQYWTEFWKTHTKGLETKDLQTQVMRLDFSRNPISEEVWKGILVYVLAFVGPTSQDIILDLCCGNGLITKAIAQKVKTVYAVDLSPEFIAHISKEGLPNVVTKVSDIRELEMPENSLTKIILYSSLHYIDSIEAVTLFVKMGKWLRKGGTAFIGDIPDKSHIWSYFNTIERKKAYFDAIIAGRQIMGNWFDMDYLTNVANYAGFSEISVHAQPAHIPYHASRVDLLMKK